MKNIFSIKASDFLLSDHQIAIDNLSVSIKELKKRLYYEDKIKHFQQVLRKTQSKLKSQEASYSSLEKNSFYLKNSELLAEFREVEIKRLQRKEEILVRLISIGQVLVANVYDYIAKRDFRHFENELISYSDFSEILLFENDGPFSIYSPIVSDTKEELGMLRYRLNLLLKKRIIRVFRDIRQSFRSIIKFLFKNMDDEDVEYNVSNRIFLKTLFNSQTFHLYGRTENNKAFICTA